MGIVMSFLKIWRIVKSLPWIIDENRERALKNTGVIDPNFKEEETKDHIISLIEVEKQTASPFDDKCWILLDGMQTLPYKHWRISAFYHYLSTGMTQENAEQREQREMAVKFRIIIIRVCDISGFTEFH
ncbi:hypothetical protein GLOIN_2v1475812 [Rhizophagus clarus]|uniref:Uncharacterized protein n=1 Tax=Rhizophagus clarus TaxID=94130 RepID=A0A8H3LWC9_9GLOM|nr:hypothetical protein GLOIN_2v1475812 [Rhizophagus clarus]